MHKALNESFPENSRANMNDALESFVAAKRLRKATTGKWNKKEHHVLSTASKKCKKETKLNPPNHQSSTLTRSQ
jgi:hypothetical protein